MKLPIILQMSNSEALKIMKETTIHIKNKEFNSLKILKEPFFKPKIRIE